MNTAWTGEETESAFCFLTVIDRVVSDTRKWQKIWSRESLKRQEVLHFKIEGSFLKINCLLGTGCVKDS